MLKLYESWKPQLNNATKQQNKTIKSASSKSLNQNKKPKTENLASVINKNNQLSQNKNSNQKSFGELNPNSIDSEDENDTK